MNMNCPKCNTERNKHRVDEVTTIHYCPNYCKHSIRLETCNHDNVTAVRVGTAIRNQCQRCGEYIGNFISTKGYDLSKLPDGKLLHSKYEERQKKSTPKVHDIFKRYNDKADSDWWEKYNEYLLTDKWKAKRLKVLERDNHTCQACLENKATEVHHKTYRYVGDEPLFDLVSVCNPCHERITEMDRRNNNSE